MGGRVGLGGRRPDPGLLVPDASRQEAEANSPAASTSNVSEETLRDPALAVLLSLSPLRARKAPDPVEALEAARRLSRVDLGEVVVLPTFCLCCVCVCVCLFLSVCVCARLRVQLRDVHGIGAVTAATTGWVPADRPVSAGLDQLEPTSNRVEPSLDPINPAPIWNSCLDKLPKTAGQKSHPVCLQSSTRRGEAVDA